jgi:hypothetical protein
MARCHNRPHARPTHGINAPTPLSESSDGAGGWTPDSQAILFNSNRSSHNEIYRQFLDHDIAEPVVTKGYGRNSQVTPDGKNLLYLGLTEDGVPITKGPQAVMLVPVSGRTPLRLFTARANSLITCGRAASARCVIGEPTDDEKELIGLTLNLFFGPLMAMACSLQPESVMGKIFCMWTSRATRISYGKIVEVRVKPRLVPLQMAAIWRLIAGPRAGISG